MTGDDTVPLDHYSAALDEIYMLREAIAYEAMVTRAHLGYKTFPKTRRVIADAQIERMREAACGHVERAYAGRSYQALRSALRDAGASETLVRAQWEEQRGIDAGAA